MTARSSGCRAWIAVLILTVVVATGGYLLAPRGPAAPDPEGGDRAPQVTDASSVVEPRTRPNVVVIVADDMGYADIGALGSEIATPNIDRLAERGTLYTRFYTAPTCSPTRAMLLTGTDNHLAGLGNMAETLDPEQVGQPGYEGYLNRDVATMAEIFGAQGYRTIMAGKWHLGMEHDQSPHARGFETSFALLGGGASHFSDRVGQDPYRTVAYYRRDGELVEDLPGDFYSSDYFTDVLIEGITEGDQARPFLGYLAFTAPHWPLQAPAESIAAQRGRYSAGYDAIRERRFDALRQAGVIPEDAIQPDGGAPPWRDLSEEQRARAERSMEVYAAMVERMDFNIGRLLDALQATGHGDDTAIVFLSDNGADGLEFAALAPAFAEWTESFDNSLSNIGLRGSFVSYGRGWAHAGEAPHTGFKGVLSEGGIRSPMIFVAPHGDRGTEDPTERYVHPVTVRDVLPTLMDIAGISDHGDSFGGRPVHGISGTSLRRTLVDPDWASHAGESLGAELWDQRAVILDEWKLVRYPAPRGDGRWRLFNLEDDLRESNDLSAEHPELFQRLLSEYASYADQVRVVEPSEPLRLIGPENPAPER